MDRGGRPIRNRQAFQHCIHRGPQGVSVQSNITQQSIITVLWDDAGPFLRFSVTYEAADKTAEDALMAETKHRLEQIKLLF